MGAVAMTVALTGLAACGSPEASSGPVPLRLGYFPNLTHATALVGVEKGIFAKNLGSTAIRHLELSIQKDPTDPSVFYHLAVAYSQVGDTEKARKSLTQSLAMKADFDGAADARKLLTDIGR